MRPRPKQKLRNGVTPEGALYSLYGKYKRDARRRNRVFELTIDDAQKLFSSNCHYCDSPPQQKFKDAILYNGIDRVDNSKGYLADNVVPACGYCNMAKRGNSVQEFFSWMNRLAEYHGKRKEAQQVCRATSQETNETLSPAETGMSSVGDPYHDVGRAPGVFQETSNGSIELK